MSAAASTIAAPRTFTTSKGHTVTSSLTDTEAADAILANNRRAGTFGAQLAQATYRGRLSQGQRPWLHKIATELLAPPAPNVEQAEAPKFAALARMMITAAARLKNPRVQVSLPAFEGSPATTLQLSVAGPTSRYPGTINVTDGRPYGSNAWFGRMLGNGSFEASPRGCPAHVTHWLALWNTDPAAIAREHGQRTASCCFCRRTLETTESLAVGYGPVCADKFGLPWGGSATPEELAADTSEEQDMEVAA